MWYVCLILAYLPRTNEQAIAPPATPTLSERQDWFHEQLAVEQGMCNAFQRNIACVAIVGNGPLDAIHRTEANACQIIIR